MFTSNINKINGIKFETKFQKALDWLINNDLVNMECGKYEIDGEHVFAYVQEYESLDWKDARYETHNKYYDLQYIVFGEELFGYVAKEELKSETGYDPKSDLELYYDPKFISGVALKKGDFIIVSPFEAHKPKACLYKKGHVKKVVVKVEY